MSDKCCCDDPKGGTDASPSRSGGGSSLPKPEGIATSTVMIAGSNGQEPGGEHKAIPLATDAAGRLQVLLSEMPNGVSGALSNSSDSITIYINNGRIVSISTAGGSSPWTFTAGTFVPAGS